MPPAPSTTGGLTSTSAAKTAWANPPLRGVRRTKASGAQAMPRNIDRLKLRVARAERKRPRRRSERDWIRVCWEVVGAETAGRVVLVGILGKVEATSTGIRSVPTEYRKRRGGRL